MTARATWGSIEKRLWPIRDVVIIGGLVILNGFLYSGFQGFVSQNYFSAPLLPEIIRGYQTLLGVDHQLAVSRILTGLLILGPVAWYAWFRYLLPSGWIATVSALLVSLPMGWWGRIRTEAVFLWGDGAHLAALSLTPLVLWALLSFLQKGGFGRGVMAAGALSLVALASPFGLMTTLIFSLIIIFSEMLLGRARLKLARAGFVVVTCLGMSSFWYNPEFFRTVLASKAGTELFRTLGNLLPLSFFVVPILATFGFLLFEKRHHLQPVFMGIFFTVIFFWISFASGLADRGLSKPSRYVPELGYSLALFMPIAGVKLFEYLQEAEWAKQRWGVQMRKAVGWGVAVISLGILGWLSIKGFESLGEMSRGETVMGWETISEQTGIWELKSTGGLWSIVGYLISGVTAVILAGMGLRIKLMNKLAPGTEAESF
jgi:hypothetical protein